MSIGIAFIQFHSKIDLKALCKGCQNESIMGKSSLFSVFTFLFMSAQVQLTSHA